MRLLDRHFGLTRSIAAGIISFLLLKLLGGEYRSLRPIMYFLAILVIAFYATVGV